MSLGAWYLIFDKGMPGNLGKKKKKYRAFFEKVMVFFFCIFIWERERERERERK